MQSWLYDWVVSGLDTVLAVQAHRTDALDALFLTATTLGNEEAYLVAIPLCYWALHKRVGQHLAYLLIVTGFFNSFMKDLFALPRPFQVDPRVIPMIQLDGPGLPSGHAMLSVALFGYVAWLSRKRSPWPIVVATVLVATISFSRIYLGVHFPADVAVGLVLGLIVLGLWVSSSPVVVQWLQRSGSGAAIGLSALVPVGMLFLHPAGASGYPANGGATFAGLFLGMNVGLIYESRQVRFSAAGAWQTRLLRYFLGLFLILVFWMGLRVAFEYVPGGRFVDVLLRSVRYALTGIALVWWAPAAFVKLGLAEREE
jgi:membrane-associated phospholipid phosphatase